MKTSRFDNVSTKQARIAKQARTCPDMVFTTLHHHIDPEWMHRAWDLTRKDGATGIDGVTAADYEKDLEANLADLMDRDQVGQLSRSAGPPPLHHESGWKAAAPWHTDPGRQGGATGHRDDPGARSTRQTSCRARMASGPADPPMTHSAICGRVWPRKVCGG